MHKGRGWEPRPEVVAGIDVSARELVVAIGRGEQDEEVSVLPNTPAGHRQLRHRLLGQRQQRARVCLEASGNYSLDLSLALDADTRIELSVVNPRQARRFAESLGKRSKTDPVDARVLREYARRMPRQVWQRPTPAALKLRAIARTLQSLTKMGAQEKNRMHAVAASAALPAVIHRELQRHRQAIAKCRRRMEREALRLLAREPQLRRRFDLLDSIPGVGTTSALMLLAELAILPATLDARQWVAHGGLDPRHVQSGSSVEQRPRISKVGNRHLRRALYMPALVAVRNDPYLAGFYQRLQAKGKTKLQALTAVMRKLLHGIHAMFEQDEFYDGARLCPVAEVAAGAA